MRLSLQEELIFQHSADAYFEAGQLSACFLQGVAQMYMPFRGGADTSEATGCCVVFPTCTAKGMRLLLPKGPFFFPEEASFQDLHSHMKLHYVFFRFLTALPSSLANFVTPITKHVYVYMYFTGSSSRVGRCWDTP